MYMMGDIDVYGWVIEFLQTKPFYLKQELW